MTADWLAALPCVPLYGSTPMLVSLGQGAAYPASYLFWTRLSAAVACFALFWAVGGLMSGLALLRRVRYFRWRLWIALHGGVNPMLYGYAAALAPLPALAVLAETWPLWTLAFSGGWRRIGKVGFAGCAVAFAGAGLASWWGAGGAEWNWTPGLAAGLGLALFYGAGGGTHGLQAKWAQQAACGRFGFARAALLGSFCVYLASALVALIVAGGAVAWYQGAQWAVLHGLVSVVANAGLMFIVRPGNPGPVLACCATPAFAVLLAWAFGSDRSLSGLLPVLLAGALVSVGSVMAGREQLRDGR